MKHENKIKNRIRELETDLEILELKKRIKKLESKVDELKNNRKSTTIINYPNWTVAHNPKAKTTLTYTTRSKEDKDKKKFWNPFYNEKFDSRTERYK